MTRLFNSPTRTAVVLFLILTAAYISTVESRVSLDVHSAHYAAWNMVVNGTISIDGLDYLVGHPIREIWVSKNGDVDVIARSPGVIAASIPGYAVAHHVFRVSAFSVWPGALTAVALCASAMVLIFHAVRITIGTKYAFLSALVLGLGTPVWAVAAEGVWPHTLTVFAIAGMAFACSRDRWWLAGLFAGIGIWGRIHLAFIAAALGLIESLRQKNWLIAVKVGVPSVLLLLLMVPWTRWMYGSWRLTGNYSTDTLTSMNETYSNVWINLLGLFFSLDRGIFIWTPLAIVLLPALVRAWRDLPGWSRSLLFGGFVYTIVQGVVVRFQGGDSFWSYRLGLELVMCASPAFILAISHARKLALRLLPALAVIQIGMMSFGASTGHGGVPAEKAWLENSMLLVFIQAPGLAVAFVSLIGVMIFLVRRVLDEWKMADAESKAK